MRILQLCSAREIGGGEKHLAGLANSLVQRGHQIFAAINPGSPLRAALSSVPSPNVIELPMRNALSLRSVYRLSRFMRENRIEIIHAHLARDYPLAALAAKRSGAHLVLTRHVLFPLSKIHRLTLRRTSRVIAVSQAVADSLRAQNIFSTERILTIHNGIDSAHFKQRRATASRAQGSRMRVGMVGHLAPIKGQEEFIQAARLICQSRKDVDFIIAGEDKSYRRENRASLEKLIRALGLEDQVQLLGWIDDIASLLGTLDVFVSPARSEPFGLAIVEAMAAGVPVVSTASEGAREIITADESGRLVSIGDVEGLAKAIADLLSDANARDRLSRNASSMARSRFSLDKMVGRTEQVYREVNAESA